MTNLNIPNKSHFKLNEVCSLTSVKPYVLRFWESEFEEISPMVSASGHKVYKKKDIQIIMIIKDLLFNQKLNVQQAKAQVIKSLSHELAGPSLDLQITEELTETNSSEEFESFHESTDVEEISLNDILVNHNKENIAFSELSEQDNNHSSNDVNGSQDLLLAKKTLKELINSADLLKGELGRS